MIRLHFFVKLFTSNILLHPCKRECFMQYPVVKIKKSHLFGLLALLLWTPLPWLYFDPPRFLQGQPLAVYAVVLFLSGISSAALAVFFVLKPRVSLVTARTVSLLFLLAGIGAYQFSGLAPNWSCFGKQIYVPPSMPPVRTAPPPAQITM